MAEKSNKLFFRAPRFKLRNTPFRAIQTGNGNESSDPAEIIRGFQKHWGKIFGDPRYLVEGSDANIDLNSQQRLLRSIDRKLSMEDSTSLDSELAVEEFTEAIKKMRPHSAPGPDGFTVDFYQLDPDLFGAILLEVFRYQILRGELLPHQRYSSVALLFKKGNRADPGNFRPITLMPVEVKIFSRVLVNRLRPHMPHLVHPDQKGFIPGRLIHQQVMLVRDLQHLITSRNRRGVATFLDFAKAYDQVNRPYLFRVLECQGFGPRFLSWIRLMYKASECSLMINGWAQDPISLSRGVKQGDPLSPFLFALALEPLGNLLRTQRDLGVTVDEDLNVPVAFFADDTVLFSKGLPQLREQLQLVECYCAGSGAQLNHSKSVIMSLNNKRKAPTLEPLRSLRERETVHYLGIPFGNFDTSTALAAQLEKKLISRLRLWKGRARTLLGRRLLAQTEILSLLWYFTSTITIPIRYLNRWQGIVNRYVLYNRVTTRQSGVNVVPKGLANRPREDDGIGVPVIAVIVRRQHLQMLQKFVSAVCSHPNDDDEDLWYRPMMAMIRDRFGTFARPRSADFLLQNPPHPAGWKANMFPLWWRHVLRDWNRLKWPSRNALSTRRTVLQFALYSPLWWNKSPEFHTLCSHGPTRTSKPLGLGTYHFRQLCRTLAQHHKVCFADFLDEHRAWPTAAAFFRRICTEVHGVLKSREVLQEIFVLYRRLSQVFHRVLPHPEAGGIQIVSGTSLVPTHGVETRDTRPTGTKSRFFPNLRNRDWNDLLQRVPELVRHPMEDLGCPKQLVHRELSNLLSLRGYLLPVVHDVMVRLFFCDLIVGSRLYFLRAMNPSIQQCVRPTCQGIETVKHCFLECPSLVVMWQQLWRSWRQVFTSPLTWRLLLFAAPRDLRAAWREKHKVVLLLWRIHTAVVFHAIWRLRNDIHFRETQAESPNILNIWNSFRKHYTFLYEHSDELHCDRATLQVTLRRLGFETPMDHPSPALEHHLWIPQL